VSGLEEAFPGRVRAQNLDATTPEAKADVAGLGFNNHGIVVRSPEGEVLFKQPDHDVNMDDVRQAVEQAVGGS
jgi:hypothetical protein